MPKVTDAELVGALAWRQRGLPPPPSQSFTVHDVYIFNSDPSRLYDEYGDGVDSSGCVYFFCNQFTYHDGWKVAAGSQQFLDGGGGGTVVGWKDTLVFQKGSKLSLYWLRLYRLRRLDG